MGFNSGFKGLIAVGELRQLTPWMRSPVRFRHQMLIALFWSHACWGWWNCVFQLDIRGSMHHSTIHKKKNPTRCNNVSKLYSLFIWSSTCFRQHTAHHQEPNTALAASGFSYLEGCSTYGWWTLSGTDVPDNVHRLERPTTGTLRAPLGL